MAPLYRFTLPLRDLPPEYDYGDRPLSPISTRSAFENAIDERDKFLGKNRCVICGIYAISNRIPLLHRCHIIPAVEEDIWYDLKERHWIPSLAEDSPEHDPRNGLLMCLNHHALFDAYTFFIRYIPETSKFVLVNYSDEPALQPFHGKAIALDSAHRHAPFPALFIIHEMRVRGFVPLGPPNPDLPVGSPWQDWILSDGVLASDLSSGIFVHDDSIPPGNRIVAQR